MYRLYKKNELNFSLVWIVSYVVLFSVADSFSASLGTEKIIAAPGVIYFKYALRWIHWRNYFSWISVQSIIQWQCKVGDCYLKCYFWNWTYCKLTERKRFNTYTLTSLLCNRNRFSFYNYFLQRKEPFTVYYCRLFCKFLVRFCCWKFLNEDSYYFKCSIMYY